MRIHFDAKKLRNKLIITVLVICIFFVLYKTIPAEEFDNKDISSFDLFYYTSLTHMGIHHSKFLNPQSFRAKLLTLGHLFIGYSILLL